MGHDRSGTPRGGSARGKRRANPAYAGALTEDRVPSFGAVRPMRSPITFVLMTFILSLSLASPSSGQPPASSPTEPAHSAGAIRVRSADGVVTWCEPAGDESGVYVLGTARGAATIASRWGGSSWSLLLFLFGLFGQGLFMGRFALQWIASERRGRSVVPLGFWWLSLAGASVLLTYFAVQREPIGVLGQVLGWPIYLRNIYMVLRDRHLGLVGSTDPAEHPVADPNAEA